MNICTCILVFTYTHIFKFGSKSRSHTSVYHALGHATISYLQAVMTFDPTDIQEAIRLVKNSIEVSGRHRKKQSVVSSMSKMMWKTNYSSYTDGEAMLQSLFDTDFIVQGCQQKQYHEFWIHFSQEKFLALNKQEAISSPGC